MCVGRRRRETVYKNRVGKKTFGMRRFFFSTDRRKRDTDYIIRLYGARPHVAAHRGEVGYMCVCACITLYSAGRLTCKRRKKNHRDRIREKKLEEGRAREIVHRGI